MVSAISPDFYEAFEAEWAEESAWNAELAAEAVEEMSEAAAGMVDAHAARVAADLATVARFPETCRRLDAILARASRESYGDFIARQAETDEEIPHSLPGGEDAEARRNVRLYGVA